MPHVAFIAFAGLRIHNVELAALGVTMPGLTARAEAVGQLPSLGLLTLAGMLPAEWTCSYHESDGVDLDVLNRVVAEQPTIAALSALTPSIDDAYAFAARLRQENIRSVLGGLHATACPEEALQYVDAVCTGEGELTWPQVLRDVAAGSLRSRYDAVRTAAPLPWALPRFDLAASSPRSRWTVQSQRGCPLACEFCAASRTLSRFREKPVDRLRSELAEITRLSPNPVLELADDNTFAGPRDPLPLLDALASANARYFTEVDWRLGERPEILAPLAASGCVQVLVGIESLIFRHPGMGAKQAALARILAAVDRIQDAGIAVNGCFIVGADGETRASIDRMRDFLLTSNFADVQITLSTPFPGTPLHNRLQRAGRLLPNRDWRHHTLFDVTFQPDAMTVTDLETSFRELLQAVYDPPATNRRSKIRREVWRRSRTLSSTPDRFFWSPPLDGEG